ncbi:MAG: VOC family protein [Pseudomonadota bacterium]|nr:VOC family protein [Pseudomonadota bacterium]
MIQIREIDHVVIRVHDLACMKQFYMQVLGCPIAREEPELGLYQLRAGASLIDLVPVDSPLGEQGGAAPQPDQHHNMDHVCVRVEPFDAEAILAFLAEHGVEAGTVESRFGAEGRGPSIYIQDPEGNTVELKGAPDLC